MASFDVTSLFTNIPVGETVEIISNQIFANRVVFEGLDRSQFIKLLSLAVRNCHFTFNNRIYQQIDGMAMGNPLGPLFANIFMLFHEKTWLHNCPSLFKPLLYRRYVDDCFLLFKSFNYVPLFLHYLNRQHPSISLTPELEKDSKLPFLNVEIFRSNSKFSTSVYHKPTFTGLFTNFHSFILLAYKRSLVSCQIRNQITQLCNAAYPHLNIRFVFRSSTRISSFFPFKDKVPKRMRSGVVYLFKCRCCSASYVGQTMRHLHTRISEHLGISPITGKPSSSPVMSSIFSHLNSAGHSANFDDFEILSSCSDTCELMIHESLLISKLKPSLNVQGSSIPLNLL